MADIKYFVTKTSLTSGGKTTKSSLLQKVQRDNITVKQFSRDSLQALIHKQRKKSIPRSALNDAVLQNIKQEQQMAKSLQDKLSSLPELHAARSKTSSSSLVSSNTFLRTLSPDTFTPKQHGYLYRSNGDVRFSRKNSIEEQVHKYEETHQKDFTAVKQNLLKATMIHSRNEKGEYTFRPRLKQLMKRESRESILTPGATDNIDIFRFITKDHGQYRQAHPRIFGDTFYPNESVLRDKPLIGRKYFVKENNRFVNSMMEQIDLLERHSNSQRYSKDTHEPQSLLREKDIPLKGGSAFVRSDPSFMSARHSSVKYMNTIGLPRARSSFNMRYGVSTQVLESRKPLLNEYMDVELQNLSKTDEEIQKYIRDIQDIVIEKDKTENRNDPLADLWQTESTVDVDSQSDALLTNQSETEELSGLM